MHTRGSFETGEEKLRKKFVGQRLGVTTKAGCYASRAHDGKGTFFMIFECFLSFLTMKMHAQACIFWSKYMTKDFSVMVSFQNRKCLKCEPRPSLFQMNYL